MAGRVGKWIAKEQAAVEAGQWLEVKKESILLEFCGGEWEIRWLPKREEAVWSWGGGGADERLGNIAKRFIRSCYRTNCETARRAPQIEADEGARTCTGGGTSQLGA